MKPNRYLIRRIRVVLNPKSSVAKQYAQPFANLMERNSKVLFGYAVLARP